MNSYIQEETIFRLAGGGDPAVSYLVRRDFPEYFTAPALSAYEEALDLCAYLRQAIMERDGR